MKSRREDNKRFYQSLAHLFYAIAAVDGHINIEEKRKIVEQVNKVWAQKTAYLDAKEVIFSTLKRMVKNDYDKEAAFQNFKKFFGQNRELFTEELKRNIMDTVNLVAISFSGRNKSESVLIYRLYDLMWNGSIKE